VIEPDFRGFSATIRFSRRTPYAVAPSGLVGMADGFFQAVPAISRWAQGVPLVKRWMNRAAVIEPPGRPPVFFMSAIIESMFLSYCAGSGMRHRGSPSVFEAEIRFAASVSSLA
jgi:hypothetical protein